MSCMYACCGPACIVFCFVLLFCVLLLFSFSYFTDVHTWFHSSNHHTWFHSSNHHTWFQSSNHHTCSRSPINHSALKSPLTLREMSTALVFSSVHDTASQLFQPRQTFFIPSSLRRTGFRKVCIMCFLPPTPSISAVVKFVFLYLFGRSLETSTVQHTALFLTYGCRHMEK